MINWRSPSMNWNTTKWLLASAVHIMFPMFMSSPKWGTSKLGVLGSSLSRVKIIYVIPSLAIFFRICPLTVTIKVPLADTNFQWLTCSTIWLNSKFCLVLPEQTRWKHPWGFEWPGCVFSQTLIFDSQHFLFYEWSPNSTFYPNPILWPLATIYLHS